MLRFPSKDTVTSGDKVAHRPLLELGERCRFSSSLDTGTVLSFEMSYGLSVRDLYTSDLKPIFEYTMGMSSVFRT